MIRRSIIRGVVVRSLRCCVLVGCVSSGLAACLGLDPPLEQSVGTPCITADEELASFSGYSEHEVNIEVGGSCGSGNVCLVHDFRGRASCPSGQIDGEGGCTTPNGDRVLVPVQPQLPTRPADIAMVCSCRCDGPDPDADYCTCPQGMSCRELFASSGRAADDLAGSYCVY